MKMQRPGAKESDIIFSYGEIPDVIVVADQPTSFVDERPVVRVSATVTQGTPPSYAAYARGGGLKNLPPHRQVGKKESPSYPPRKYVVTPVTRDL